MKMIKLFYVFFGVLAVDSLNVSQENIVKAIAFVVWVLLGTLTQVGIRRIVLKQEIKWMHSFFIFFISFAVGYIVFESMSNLGYIAWRSVAVIISAMVSEGLVVSIYNNTPVWLAKMVEVFIKNKEK